jgi:hypothetical protein
MRQRQAITTLMRRMDPVDLSLVLALDCSASVTYEEFARMAGGLAQALRDADVVSGRTGGPRGASQCALLLFSGIGAQEVLIEWTRIASAADAGRFADAVDNTPRVVRAGLTAVGEALLATFDLLGAAPADASRSIVDLVGDGSSNAGLPPATARDRLVAAGVTINGLCVLHEEPDLVAYFTAEVIGGPGAFALSCPDYVAFADAMRQKLIREIA